MAERPTGTSAVSCRTTWSPTSVGREPPARRPGSVLWIRGSALACSHALGKARSGRVGAASAARHRGTTCREASQGDEVRAMPEGDIETYYDQGQWKNRVEGKSRASSVHENKAEAVTVGRQRAMERKVGHVVRNMDG